MDDNGFGMLDVVMCFIYYYVDVSVFGFCGMGLFIVGVLVWCQSILIICCSQVGKGISIVLLLLKYGVELLVVDLILKVSNILFG